MQVNAHVRVPDSQTAHACLRFEKRDAQDLLFESEPGSVRDKGAKSTRAAESDLRSDRRGFGLREPRAQRSSRYARRAFVARLARKVLDTHKSDDQQGDEAEAASSVTHARTGRAAGSRTKQSKTAQRESVASGDRTKRTAPKTTRAQQRKQAKAASKEFTRAAQAKRRVARVAQLGNETAQASVAATAKKKKPVFKQGLKEAFAPAGGIGASLGGAVVLGALFFLIIAAVLGIIATDESAAQTDLTGLSEVEARVALYLLDQGFDPLHVSAIMGNIEAESSFDPELIEVGSGEGYGLCQWSFERKSQLFTYAAAKNKPASDVQIQLDFLMAEISGEGDASGYSNVQIDRAAFENITVLEDAVMYFGRKFERPSEVYAHWDRRIESARRYYAILSSSGVVSGNGIVQAAALKIGCPYVWGATGPDTFDCSGLVQWAYAQNNISISRTTYTQIKQCVPVPLSAAAPGDLVFMRFSGSGIPEHVGIYIGNGQMIHAPRTGQTICIADISIRTDAKTYRFVG